MFLKNVVLLPARFLCDAEELKAKKITAINTSALVRRGVCDSHAERLTNVMLKKYGKI